RPYSDMVAKKERDLLDLAPYTAAYKLLPSDGGAPIKGVLSTDALPPEHKYYIAHGLRRSIIATTHEHFCMSREEIEKEISKRQGRAEDRDDVLSGTQPSAAPEAREQKTK